MKRMRSVLLALVAVLAAGGAREVHGQKKPLDHDVYDGWKSIRGEALSDDGRWALFEIVPADGQGELRVRSLGTDVEHVFPRGKGARFTADSRFAVFLIAPEEAEVEAAKKAKKKPAEMPKDSLAILELSTGSVVKVERVRSFRVPEEAAGWLAYLQEAEVPDAGAAEKEDGEAEAAGEEKEEVSKALAERRKKKTEGTTLVLRDLLTGEERRFDHVVDYQLSDNGVLLAYAASSKDGGADGVYAVTLSTGTVVPVLTGEGEYKRLVVDAKGEQVAFLSNRDDFAAEQAAYVLYHWRTGERSARAVAGEGMPGVPAGWWVSEHGALTFSESGRRLYFGTAPRPEPEPDEETLPPAEERVVLDVWNWRDPYLQPMQLVQADQERKRTYTAVLHTGNRKVVQLASAEVPEVRPVTKRDPKLVVGVSDLPYRQLISWEMPRYVDVYLVDVEKGERVRVLEKTQGQASLSPDERHLVWYDGRERAYLAMDVKDRRIRNLTEGVPYPIHDEDDDHPAPPPAYGAAGWTDAGTYLVYDRHDVWELDPTGRRAPRNVTEGVGRAEGLRFRYVRLDQDAEVVATAEPILLDAFHLWTKASGFYRDRVKGDARPERLILEDRSFGWPRKAGDADVVMLTRERFDEFPDLWVTDLDFTEMRRISDANPQQADYLWGTAELVEWRSADGTLLQGILYKPEDFDPSRKYPMMVYFYERMSDGLHSYRTPVPGGSSISFSFYVSRGYLVFVPDIPYEIGYPGESAVHAVVPGVLSLIEKGFVDEKAIGVQGHSWGGYQIAYMITQTDLFAAAEAGAPVANMTSAYGGIRWTTGMSRMFQYEQTQSRIGATLWDAPHRYIENSPIFWADKVRTPLLMMHNDQDGAVPWYQGIEYFVALRRLGKPVWLLNYNGEDHGLRKYQNRKDWAVRMQQFFDHFLKGAPAPVWLAEGIPATMKGRTLGLELVGETTTADGN